MTDDEPRHETRMEAAQAGRHIYLRQPCQVCGDEQRYVSSGQCVACTKVRASRYLRGVRDTLHRVREATG